MGQISAGTMITVLCSTVKGRLVPCRLDGANEELQVFSLPPDAADGEICVIKMDSSGETTILNRYKKEHIFNRYVRELEKLR